MTLACIKLKKKENKTRNGKRKIPGHPVNKHDLVNTSVVVTLGMKTLVQLSPAPEGPPKIGRWLARLRWKL